jgi:hypothetical protein
MKTEHRIRAIAEDLVEHSYLKTARLIAELIEAQQRVEQLTAELKAAKQAPKHLTDFQIRHNGDYQCPRCGIQRGVQASMTFRQGQHRLDLLQCDTCGFDMDVQY